MKKQQQQQPICHLTLFGLPRPFLHNAAILGPEGGIDVEGVCVPCLSTHRHRHHPTQWIHPTLGMMTMQQMFGAFEAPKTINL